jgi:type I restriction enzyme S subunit
VLQYENARIRTGDLVMTIVGANTGQVTRVPGWLDGAVLSRSTARIAIDNDATSSQFIYFYLQSRSAQTQVRDYLKEGAQPVLSCADLTRFQIPLPPTLREQEAIAEALSDADAYIESLEQLLEKKRAIKQGAMQELLTGKRRLPGFDDEWIVTAFGDLVQTRSQHVDPGFSAVNEFCVELENISQVTGMLLGHSATSPLSSLKTIFKRGDVLFGKLRAYLRKYWLATQDGVCSTELWALVPQPSRLLPEFLFQIVRTGEFIEAASLAYGTHMPRSDWNVVKALEIRLPGLPEQAAIVSILSDIDADISTLDAKLAKARDIKQGMMQQLLTGKIRLV